VAGNALTSTLAATASYILNTENAGAITVVLDPAGGVGLVTSVFGRVGAVVAQNGDYDSSQITNLSGVAGATVTAALDTLNTAVAGRVPTTRTLTTTSPLRIDGIGSADLSANRTLTVLDVSNTSSGVAPQHAGAADVGKALIATATGSTWSANFQAQDITTTGVVRFGFTPVASTGLMRVGNGWTAYFRNFANTADLLGISLGNGGATDTCVFGSFGAAGAPSSVFTQRNGVGSLLQSGTTVLQWGSAGITVVTTGAGVFNFTLSGQIQQNGVTLFGWPNSPNRNLSIYGDGSQNYQTGEKIVAVLDRIAEPTAGTAGMYFFYSQNGRPTWRTGAGDRIEWNSTSAAGATAGGGAALPATVAEFLTIQFNGNVRKIPLYAN
jgi:hypothetical protein